MVIKLRAPLRIATFNVRGLGARRRQCQLNRLLLDNGLDIAAVQESKLESQEQADRMVPVFRANFDVCVCHSVGVSGGCLLFIRNTLGIRVETVYACDSGRLLVVDFSFSNLGWRVVCVYAQNVESERLLFFQSLEPYLNCDKCLILLGDFNCVCSAKDRVKCRSVKDKSAELLSSLVHDYFLEDVGGMYSSGSRPEYTHFQRDSHARLDRLYVSVALVPLCTAYNVNPVSYSDHCLVSATFGVKGRKSPFNWYLWKLNEKILDEEFAREIASDFEAALVAQTGCAAVDWESFKERVKLKAIEKSSVIRFKQKENEKELHDLLECLLNNESAQPGTFTKQIKDVKCEMERIDNERYRAAVIRSRSEKLWAGEAPTKRALSDEKRYACMKEIRQLSHEGHLISDSRSIQRVITQHFADLFSKKREHAEGFQDDFLRLMPTLDDDVRERLEMPITLEEIEKAIDDLPSGKAPGPDGLNAAFYKTFKGYVSQFLLNVITEAYERKKVPLSFATSHVVLIPKSEDPEKRTLVGSYRPISLTNVDYKVYMKVLAKRLQCVIDSLVGQHQTCGIRGRSITTNIHVARTVLECVDALGNHVAMIQLDLAKAFDRVSHDILFSILEHANLGSVIVEGVKMAYANCTTRVIVNGDLTDKLAVRSSVRQGCPLSPLLFALYLEPLCLAILNSDHVMGFKLQSAHVKLLAYADDIALFCTDRSSICEATSIVERFCKQTGCLVNWEKSSGFWHGEWDIMPPVFSRLQWSPLPTRYLGVPLERYRDPGPHWNEETSRAREKVDAWQGRQLSIFSRAFVCNVFLISKIWYVMSVLCASRTAIQKMHRVFAVFLWTSTWERTRRTNLFRSVKSGGVGLVHLFLRQVVSRFIFLRDQNDIFLRTVMQLRLQRLLPRIIVSAGDNMCGAVTGFLREVVLAYQLLEVRFSPDYLYSVPKRKLYKDLVDIMLPVPLYREPYYGGPGQNILKRVKKMPVRPAVKTFFFKLHSNTLPVKTWLQDKGIFVPWTTNCLLCKKPETIEHAFLDCWDAIFHWDILQRTLKKELPLNPYGIRFLPVDNQDVPYDMFMLLGLHSLWKTRMQMRHAEIDIRSSREHFIESVVYIRECIRAQPEPPEWAALLDDLAKLKKF